MRISLDLHGVIDKDPKGFNEYAKELVKNGHEVYILTGSSYEDAISELAEVKFNLQNIKEIISTTDYLLDKNTSWELDKWQRPVFNEFLWWGVKGNIARARKFDLHIDDCIKYEKTFTTPFALYEGIIQKL